MKTTRNKTIGLCLAAVVLLGQMSFAERLWPLQVGQSFTYTQSAPSSGSWTVRIDVKGYRTFNSIHYFNIWGHNNENKGKNENWGYVRATENHLYSSPDHDLLDFQKAPVGTKWYQYNPGDTYPYKVIEIVAIEPVTVPYGHFEEAYKHRKYKCDDPDDPWLRSPDWYEWVVPGVGWVKQEDYWVSGPAPMVMELVEITQNTEPVSITKFTAKAGKSPATDSVQFSGVLGALGLEVLVADDIVIGLDAEDMAAPVEWTFPINTSTFKNGTFNGRGADSSFRYSIKNGRMTFSAKNVDLTGLACPLTVTITIGDSSESIELDADIVNGPKRPCPPQFLMGVRNSMTVDRAQVKFGKKPNTDSLTVRGFFTIADDYDKNSNPMLASLGTQTFTVSGDQFKPGKFSESCNKAASDEGPLVKAKFDFAKCTFQIQVSNLTISEHGVVPLGLMLFDQDLTGFATIDLGPKQSFSLENDFRHFNIPRTLAYSPDGYTIVTGASGPNYYSTLGSEDTLHWFTDNDGTYLKRMLMTGEFYNCDITTNVLSNPSLMRNGQIFTGSDSFTGTMNVWVPDDPSIDVDIYNFGGTLKVTTKALGWQNVVVPAGAFNAFKIEQTFTLSATMRVVLYDNLDGTGMDTTGTFSGNYKVTYWCDPDIGIIKLIDTGREKVTAKGAGSLSDSWTQTKLLESK